MVKNGNWKRKIYGARSNSSTSVSSFNDEGGTFARQLFLIAMSPYLLLPTKIWLLPSFWTLKVPWITDTRLDSDTYEPDSKITRSISGLVLSNCWLCTAVVSASASSLCRAVHRSLWKYSRELQAVWRWQMRTAVRATNSRGPRSWMW